MAEVSQEGGGGGKHKGGKPKGKKSSTHIDMTPMVDLAFLLLTFFMLTASFSRPKVMEIRFPEKKKNNEQPDLVKNRDNVMNLLIGPGDKLIYYFDKGKNQPIVPVTTNYGVDGIQSILMRPEYKNNPQFLVLIKAAPDAKFKHLIDMFDITRVTDTKQAMVDITPKEIDLLKGQ